MVPETVYMVGQDAMIVAIKLTAPVLLPSLAVGLIVAMFQAATQINEATLTFIPKLVAIGAVLMIMGPSMMQMFLDYFQGLVRDIPQLIG
ncbi:MAG: flagellar biosynthesis protein FliQ [Methylococcales bacterium]|nr:flagellar biosynthesis protein FliQ [Methylobacter sp.]MDZ4157155.1 flagellar biosynthesis protein FliQ [Methylococcales bacterium]MDP2099224.1 flagellar biosynthesis protein FliQ [Methylobacter sp.]MDP2428424.1 flagellar biosynthesis protein FliQ [Methylobacter sp.]MDP3056649.1 flagellar biosynthesis protein FliQ [Methylobacter sp.]